MEVESADGVVHEFPDSTDMSVVNQAMKNYAASKFPQKQAEPAAPDKPEVKPEEKRPEPRPQKPDPWEWSFQGQNTPPPRPATPEPTPEAEPAPDINQRVVQPSRMAQGFIKGATEGFQSTPPILTEKGEQILRQHGFGANTIGFINSPSYALGALNALWHGGVSALFETLTPVIGEQGARDLVSMPDAFMGTPHPTGIPHVGRPLPHEAAAMREAQSYAESPLTFAPDINMTPEDRHWADLRATRAARDRYAPDVSDYQQGDRWGPPTLRVAGPESPPRRAPTADDFGGERPIQPDGIQERYAPGTEPRETDPGPSPATAARAPDPVEQTQAERTQPTTPESEGTTPAVQPQTPPVEAAPVTPAPEPTPAPPPAPVESTPPALAAPPAPRAPLETPPVIPMPGPTPPAVETVTPPTTPTEVSPGVTVDTGGIRTRDDIADEYEKLGDEGMAKAVRAGARFRDGNSPEQIAFLEQKLALFKASRPGSNTPKPQETFDLSSFMSRMPHWKNWAEGASPEGLAMADRVQAAAQTLNDRMNELGATRETAGQSGQTPPEAQVLKRQFSELTGQFSRYSRAEIGFQKGQKYKWATAEALEKERTALLEDLAKIETPETGTQTNQPTAAAPQTGAYTMLRPDQLQVDPKRFQFKESDEQGVTGVLRGTTKWESDLASPIMAWQDNSGQYWVADGHQRHDLATRATAAGQQGVEMPARVYREADGYTPEHMRVLAAYKNIAEGSGTPVDAAKVLRAKVALPGNRALPSLPPRSQMVQQGNALAKLGDEAFGIVVNGIVPPGYAAHVGDLISDPAQQVAALSVLARADPSNSEQARSIVKDIVATGYTRDVEGGQTEMEGMGPTIQSLFPERARILDRAKANLRGNKRVFGAAVRGEESLTAAGNQLDREGNVRAKTENEQLLDILERQASSKGPISDALTTLASDLAGGKALPGLVSQFLTQVRGIVRRGANEAVRPGDTFGGDGEAGQGPEPPVEGQGGFFGQEAPRLTFDQMVARGEKVKRQAAAYAEAGKPASFRDNKYGITYLVSKDLNYPPDGWRVTMFGKDGQPSGHWEAKSAYDAFREVIAGPKERIGPNHPPEVSDEFGQEGSRIPLYSAVERAVEGLKQAKGTGEQMLSQVTKTPGVKAEEIKFLNLAEWLRGQKSVTREELLDYVRANALEVHETVHTDNSAAEDDAWKTLNIAEQKLLDNLPAQVPLSDGTTTLDTNIVARLGRPGSFDVAQLPPEFQDMARDYQIAMSRLREIQQNQPPQPRFQQWTLNKGATKKYFELTFTIPSLKDDYDEPHWPGEKKVVAHMRGEELVGPNGERIFNLIENQSQLHQTGKKKGYAREFTEEEREVATRDVMASRTAIGILLNQYDHLGFDHPGQARRALLDNADYADRWDIDPADIPVVDEFRRSNQVWNRMEGRGGVVPDAPFKTSWPALVVKRALKWAVDNGYDMMTWEPGQVHADRYNLAEHVKSITLHGKGDDLHVDAYDHGDNRVVDKKPTTREKLADMLGKEVAERLLSQPEPDHQYGYRKIEGDDLKVGGGGMRGFYDKQMPTEVQKIVGKYGVKVGKIELPGPPGNRDLVKPDAQALQDHGPRSAFLARRLAQIRRDLEAMGPTQKYDDTDLVAEGLWSAQDHVAREQEILHNRMIDETLARGQKQMYHAVPIPPALRQAIQDQGLSLFQPKSRIPKEYTIQNDPNQNIMPGMEASTPQAQAARDQAQGGRGTLVAKVPQKAANEGLFAPYPPQKSLFDAPAAPPAPAPPPPKAVSVWAKDQTHPDFVDQLHTVGNLDGGVQGAANWVFDTGRQTGFEHIAVVDAATGQIVHAGTINHGNRVALAPGPLTQTADTHVAVHNHPSGGAISGQDLSMLAVQGIGHVVAIGHGGQFYAVRLDPKIVRSADPAEIIQLQEGMLKAFDALTQTMVDHAFRQYRFGNLTRDEAEIAWGDMVNRALHAMGVTEYISSHQLTPPLIANLADTLRTLGNGQAADDIHRYAVVTDASKGFAGLPGKPSNGVGQGLVGGQGSAGKTGQNLTGPKQGTLFDVSGELEALGPRLTMPGGGPNVDIVKNKTGFAKAIAEVKVAFSPTSLKGAKPMEYPIRKHGAEAALAYQRAVHTLRKVRDAVDRLSKADQLDFTDRMERGLPQATPALNRVANTLRTVLDDWKQQIRSLGQGYLDQAVQDYMGHIWGNYHEWAGGQPNPTQAQMTAAAQAASQAKQPLQGSGNFLKPRTFATQMDGINAGLIPVTYNPIDMQLLKIREMQKFYYGSKLADFMKATGLAVWVPERDTRAYEQSGWVKLDDHVFQPQLRGVSPIGPITPGAYYAIEPQARLFNRYMSRGLLGHSIWYDMTRVAGNAMNTAQLAWPGFHTSFVTMDTANSRSALGLQQIANGLATLSPTQVGKGLGSVALGIGPGAVVKAMVSGSRMRRALLDPNNLRNSPEYLQLAQDFIMGGGRMSMDQFYQSSASGSFVHQLKDLYDPRHIIHEIAQLYRDTPPGWRKLVVPPLRIFARSLDTLMHPLMGVLVPRAKMGVFAENAREWNKQNPNATLEERQAAMTTIWDNVEDRLGQMTYDNVFWHKVMKDVAFITFRSVGWNLGTQRAGLGAAYDTAKAAADMARLRSPKFTGRMAYAIAQFANTALVGAFLTYLFTGKGPEDWLDYFFPRTGGTTPDGHPERVSIPGYVKDWIEFAHDPVGTILNKTHPLLSFGNQIRTNRDYYGGIVYSPSHDPSMAAAYGDFVANSVMPFTIQGFNKLTNEEASDVAKWLSLGGFQPAPKSIVAPERAEGFHKRDEKRAYRQRERNPGRIHFFTPNLRNSPPQEQPARELETTE